MPDLVIEMAGMGFDPEHAAAALRKTRNNVEQALELLISGFTAASSTSSSTLTLSCASRGVVSFFGSLGAFMRAQARLHRAEVS